MRFYAILSNSLIALMLVCLGTFAFLDPVKSVVFQDMSKVYYNGNTELNKVSLMINVYWGNEYLNTMLSTFKKHGIKTTFFVGGMWAEKFNDELLKIVADGHEIGNHGYFHKSQDKLNLQQNKEEIFNTHKLIRSLTGIEMNLFAPPSGAYGDATLQAAKNLGYSTIMWTRDTIDWRDQDEELIYSRTMKNIKGGDLILMHPTKATANVLEKLITSIESRGLELCIVSKNIQK